MCTAYIAIPISSAIVVCLKVFGSITKGYTSPRSSEALRLMKARLLAYIQECLLVSGFDTLDMIALIDDDFNNFIDQI